jgi:2-polyprenyl-6-methoxyphenol hydroxylase-like FAD-dependent oxidoreductase
LAKVQGLIIGAEPTGLTLVCDLARRGVPFRLVEAATAPFGGSQGNKINPACPLQPR